VFIKLTHNMEIAHRLFLMPGKCQQIHGHSMTIDLTLHGNPDENGVFEGLDFGDVKKVFRRYIDENYDHKLLLNVNDPWAQPIETVAAYEAGTGAIWLPGLVAVPGDPTTENLAKWILEWAQRTWDLRTTVYIQETKTNGVGAY